MALITSDSVKMRSPSIKMALITSDCVLCRLVENKLSKFWGALRREGFATLRDLLVSAAQTLSLAWNLFWNLCWILF